MYIENRDLISVIMPAYNSEKYIEESIISVLNQTYDGLELIVVNDHSSDNTLKILNKIALKDSRLRIINNQNNMGCAESRNIALKYATGKYIAFCDSDDIWAKDKLYKQINLIKLLKIDVIYTGYEMIDIYGNTLKTRNVPPSITFKDLLKENSIIFSTTLFKKDVFENIYFKNEWYHEDYILLLDCLSKSLNFYGLDDSLVRYRIHTNGRSFNKVNSAKFRWKIYREYLKLDIFNSIIYFSFYFFNGIIKYR